MILITGASGNTGGAVLNEVLNVTTEAAAMVRSPKDAEKLPVGLRTVIADFADKASLSRALEGIDHVFLVCSPIPQLVEFESNMLDACKQAGVHHVVLNSALGAGDYPKSFPSWHRQVEDKLKTSGLGYTILRPNSFMQNLTAFYTPTIQSQGAFYSSIGDARMSYIDLRDIAQVAAIALTSPGHAGKTYELNGPEALTYAEIAKKISAAARREVRYIDIPVEQQREAMQHQQMPDWLITALLDLQAYYTGGKGGEVDDVLPTLLGGPARTMDEFVKEYAGLFIAKA